MDIRDVDQALEMVFACPETFEPTIARLKVSEPEVRFDFVLKLIRRESYENNKIDRELINTRPKYLFTGNDLILEILIEYCRSDIVHPLFTGKKSKEFEDWISDWHEHRKKLHAS